MKKFLVIIVIGIVLLFMLIVYVDIMKIGVMVMLEGIYIVLGEDGV